jgi:LytR cell envelope-related transcriptional attenuator
VLDDLTKIQALLSVAQQYLITDAGWNLLDFAAQMRSLTSGDLTFRTLPIVGYQTIDGQDANVINPGYIQQIVQETFYPAPSSPAASPSASATAAAGNRNVTADIYNGGNIEGLAGQVSAALVKDGYEAGQVGNTSPLTTTEVLYGSGTAASASKIAALFSVTATASSSIAAGHVEVLLGTDATLPASTPTASPSSSAAPIPSTGAQGGAVTAKNGIPCVN